MDFIFGDEGAWRYNSKVFDQLSRWFNLRFLSIHQSINQSVWVFNVNKRLFWARKLFFCLNIVVGWYARQFFMFSYHLEGSGIWDALPAFIYSVSTNQIKKFFFSFFLCFRVDPLNKGFEHLKNWTVRRKTRKKL